MSTKPLNFQVDFYFLTYIYIYMSQKEQTSELRGKSRLTMGKICCKEEDDDTVKLAGFLILLIMVVLLMALCNPRPRPTVYAVYRYR
ncbi:hypothetical protein GQ457_12G005010 [Hibiscus cannabinus]